jgi:hypothetical protein
MLHIDHISDEMRAVVESEWPELAVDEQLWRDMREKVV